MTFEHLTKTAPNRWCLLPRWRAALLWLRRNERALLGAGAMLWIWALAGALVWLALETYR